MSSLPSCIKGFTIKNLSINRNSVFPNFGGRVIFKNRIDWECHHWLLTPHETDGSCLHRKHSCKLSASEKLLNPGNATSLITPSKSIQSCSRKPLFKILCSAHSPSKSMIGLSFIARDVQNPRILSDGVNEK